MAGIENNSGNATHQVAKAILLEAVQRIADKEHSRDDVFPGSFQFDFTVTGTVMGRAIEPLAFAGMLSVAEDGVKTPSTPYQSIAGYLLGKMNEATRQACLQSIAAGEFETDAAVKGQFEAVCKQWREATKAASPERQRGNVKPVYAAAEPATAVATTTAQATTTAPRKTRKAG